MAGHVTGRGQTAYSHRQPQSSHQRQRSDSKTQAQGTSPTHPQSNSDTTADPPKPKLRTSCDGCQEAKLGCSQEKPTCRRCLRHGITCVYSPFRRIGRPRKSTNPRTANGPSPTKSRPKNENVHEMLSSAPTENLPELETDNHLGSSSLFFDPVPAPPSSPASTDNGGGAWYPWTPDGNSLYNGLHMDLDNPVSVMDGTDPYLTTAEYLDLDAYFDSHHNVLMDCTMSKGEAPMLDLGQSMQPTPPSSTIAEMTTFGETSPKSSDTYGMNTLLSQHTAPDQPGTNGSPAFTSTSNIPGLKLETSSYDDLGAFRSHALGIQQSPTSVRQSSQIFGPSPELTPPPSAQSPRSQSPCNKRCSSSLIQQLASLNQHLSESTHPSVDTVLQVEKDALALCRRIISCNPCIGNRSSYLLFSMVVEQVMRLLETIPDRAPSESCSLLIGTFEIDNDTKTSFLKRYLLGRLSKFTSMLKEFARTIDEDEAEDYNSNAAKDMLRDVFGRLDLLKGIIEMWD